MNTASAAKFRAPLRLIPPFGAWRRRRWDRPEYLAFNHQVDIELDTFPYNGHTTSLDSFRMGVPVITLVGSTVVGKAGLSQLTNLGLKEMPRRRRKSSSFSPRTWRVIWADFRPCLIRRPRFRYFPFRHEMGCLHSTGHPPQLRPRPSYALLAFPLEQFSPPRRAALVFSRSLAPSSGIPRTKMRELPRRAAGQVGHPTFSGLPETQNGHSKN